MEGVSKGSKGLKRRRKRRFKNHMEADFRQKKSPEYLAKTKLGNFCVAFNCLVLEKSGRWFTWG